MKTVRICLLAALALLATAFLFRNVVLKRQLEKVLAEQTGFGLEVDRVHLGWNLTSFELEGAKLTNPPDFPDGEALEIRRVKVDLAFWSLFTREIRFREVVLDVGKLVVVRKADGESNAERLGGKAKPQAGGGGGGGGGVPAPPEDPSPAPKKEPPGFRIDRLVLKVGAVEMRDYTKARDGGEPAVTAMTLNVDQEHRDVTSLPQLGSLVLGGAIQQMGLFLIGQELQDKDSKLNQKIQKAAGKFQKKMDKLFGAPQE